MIHGLSVALCPRFYKQAGGGQDAETNPQTSPGRARLSQMRVSRLGVRGQNKYLANRDLFAVQLTVTPSFTRVVDSILVTFTSA